MIDLRYPVECALSAVPCQIEWTRRLDLLLTGNFDTDKLDLAFGPSLVQLPMDPSLSLQ